MFFYCIHFSVLVQIVYFALDVTIAMKSHDSRPLHISLVPVAVWVLTFVWPPVTLMIQELVKRREIKYEYVSYMCILNCETLSTLN